MLILALLSKKVNRFYNRFEDRFISNFYQRQAQNSFKIPQSLENQFQMERIAVSAYSDFAGVSLLESQFRQDFGVNVVSIERAGTVIDLPSKDFVIMPCDRLTIIGNEDQIARVRAVLDVEPEMIILDHSDNEMNIYRYMVVEDGPLCGNDLSHSNFQKRYNAMIIAIERNHNYMLNPPAHTIFEVGDVVWFVSPEEMSFKKFIEK